MDWTGATSSRRPSAVGPRPALNDDLPVPYGPESGPRPTETWSAEGNRSRPSRWPSLVASWWSEVADGYSKIHRRRLRDHSQIVCFFEGLHSLLSDSWRHHRRWCILCQQSSKFQQVSSSDRKHIQETTRAQLSYHWAQLSLRWPCNVALIYKSLFTKNW